MTPIALNLRETPDLSQGVGIIDIGSNSVRLVVYADHRRTPFPIFNEKVLCGLGRTIGTTGALDPEGIDKALAALARFRGLTSALGITNLDVVATAAAREASNGAQFIERAENACGVRIAILSGQDEAHYAAEGVAAGFPDADGMVGDLGGGSLELVEIANGRHGEGTTLPVGPLRLIDLSGGDIAKARDLVTKAFDEAKWLADSNPKAFYAVGGNWRNLARMHMAGTDYPLRVLQAYTMRKRAALELSQLVSAQSRKSLEHVPDVSRRRLETLPFAALVLEQVLQIAQPATVVVSAYGVREGLLYSRLSPEERRVDPLISWAERTGARLGRFTEHGEELKRFTAPLFKTGLLAAADTDEQRLHHAACHLSDIGWRIHPDYRSQHVMLEILRAPVSGIDHPGRVYLSLAVANRYRSGLEDTSNDRVIALLDSDKARRATALGLALRLAHTLSAGAPRLVEGFRLKVEETRLTLQVPSGKRTLLGEVVVKRLTGLARVLGLEADVEISDIP
ncbi:Ppx/GppA family phosphatase [Pyruvatibacter sp.]|uniref:Ppx/GppA family phosphatase n=1 Tax=Pyruvatibacter sp. TaxID=1981328 RepID=UPI0032EFAEE9